MQEIPQAVIRTDSSTFIGSGHVMRCLTLAKELKRQGWTVSFICRDFPGNLTEYIRQEEFAVHLLPKVEESQAKSLSFDPASWLGVDWQTDAQQTAEVLEALPEPADCLLVDHYAIAAEWERYLKKSVKLLFVIDDLAQNIHACDLLLNQNMTAHLDTRYEGKVPAGARLLLGPDYVLLRPEFARLRSAVQPGELDPSRLLLFFGGSDPGNQTMKTMQALITIKNIPFTVDVVVGASYPYINELYQFCEQYPQFTPHVQTKEMACLMQKAGLIVGAGGTNTWERLCLGKPSIVLAVAENQIETAMYLHELGLIDYLGESDKVSAAEIAGKVSQFLHDPKQLHEMSQKCFAAVDGLGVQRVTEVLRQSVETAITEEMLWEE
ncbi:UDP-2,4-diacetamido-2,4,6-trideoxy-beta-L-altropyranose hydrolase [Brevibacillus fulvus]|uniref:UDP-2,4-diacetamido-2,4, 6-trideoxy-beta-L-altropyranose hydrolase n=1 Tax=Brevibacillus fulvus TaxID=1125967 RepID=A0A938Y188_9BACL|nr:UDP-2,4-diacetamido-2,4,6-trideoxy-beta-L-altropyranose hydrolase [Brevibacillus fulvus]